MAAEDTYYVMSWRVKKDYKAKIDELAKNAGMNTSAYLRELTQSAVDRSEDKDELQLIKDKFKELEEANNEAFDTLNTKLDIITKLLLKS